MPIAAQTVQSQRLYFWNKSHLNIFVQSDKGDLLSFEEAIRFHGETPQSVLEYILDTQSFAVTTDTNAAADAIISSSYTIYQYYDKHHFPINSVQPAITYQQASALLKKLGTEQLVIIDIDDSFSATTYCINASTGMHSIVIEADNGVEVDYRLDNYHVTYHVDEILTKALIDQIQKELQLDNSLQTVWLFTGEVITHCNNAILDFVQIFFSNLSIDLPINNKVVIDKYSLANYLEVLPANFLDHNFRASFAILPITIFNLNNLPSKEMVKLKYKDGSDFNYYIQKKRDNFITVDRSGYLFEYLNLSFSSGVIWLWQLPQKTNSIRLPKLSFLANIIPFHEIKPFITLSNSVKQMKATMWHVPIGTAAYKKLEIGEALDLSKRQRFLRDQAEQYLYVPGMKKEDFLVVNGQKVLAGEVLNKKNKSGGLIRKEVIAPTTGIISFKYLDEGFLAIRSQELYLRDMGWLKDSSTRVMKKLPENNIAVMVESYCVPLSVVKGSNFFGNLVCLSNIKELDQYQDNPQTMAFVVRETVNYQEVLAAFNRGIKAIIVPDILGMEKIAPDFWQLFSLGVYSKACSYFPDHVMTQLLLRQFNECFFDSQSKQFKIRLDDEASATFMPEHLPKSKIESDRTINSTALVKGALVKSTSYQTLFRAAKIIHRDRNALLLQDLETEQLFSETTDNVKLV